MFEPIPPLHVGHPLFELAHQLVRRWCRVSTLTSLVDPLYDELMGTALLALVEGRDPKGAIRVEQKREQKWRLRTVPLFDFEGASI